jgi:hypothetical protein
MEIWFKFRGIFDIPELLWEIYGEGVIILNPSL